MFNIFFYRFEMFRNCFGFDISTKVKRNYVINQRNEIFTKHQFFSRSAFVIFAKLSVDIVLQISCTRMLLISRGYDWDSFWNIWTNIDTFIAPPFQYFKWYKLKLHEVIGQIICHHFWHLPKDGNFIKNNRSNQIWRDCQNCNI